jgi:hypothetical protein
MMTPISRLLMQKATLCLRAFEQTRDLNEAHILVHGVISNALGRINGPKQDLALAMESALDARARRLGGLPVPT